MIREASQALVSIYTTLNAVLYMWMIIRRLEYQRQGWLNCRRSRSLTPSQASLLSALYLLGSGTLLRIFIDFVTDMICLSNSDSQINMSIDIGNLVFLAVRAVTVFFQLIFFHNYSARMILNKRFFHKAMAFLVAGELWTWLYLTTNPIWGWYEGNALSDGLSTLMIYLSSSLAPDCDKFWLAKVGHFFNPLSVEYCTVAVIALLELWSTAITQQDCECEEQVPTSQAPVVEDGTVDDSKSVAEGHVRDEHATVGSVESLDYSNKVDEDDFDISVLSDNQQKNTRLISLT